MEMPKYLGVFVTENYQGNDDEKKASYNLRWRAPQPGHRAARGLLAAHVATGHRRRRPTADHLQLRQRHAALGQRLGGADA